MPLTKYNVCLFIKDEKHLEEMREFLEGKGEDIGACFYLTDDIHDYLQCVKNSNTWALYCTFGVTELTTEQFKKLWE